MQNNLKKAVEFGDTRVKADDLQSKANEKSIVREYLSSRITNAKKGDLLEIPLPKNKLMKLEVVDDGLYSGWVQDSINNDILYNLEKQTFSQIVDNVVNHDPSLQETKKEVKQPEGKNIVININIQKAIEELIDMAKANPVASPGNIVKLTPEKTDEEKEEEKKQREAAENDKEKDMEKKAKKSSLFNFVDSESLNKSVEDLAEPTKDIVDFDNYDDYLETDQSKILKSNIEKSIKN